MLLGCIDRHQFDADDLENLMTDTASADLREGARVPEPHGEPLNRRIAEA